MSPRTGRRHRGRYKRKALTPAVDFRFRANGELPGGGATVTFTRASDGTYRDSSGTLQTASTNGARFDHNTSNQSLGLLIEGARTNILTRSEELNDAAWSKVRSTVSPNATAAPDGATTADELIEDGTASATHAAERSGTVTANTTVALSVYVKANTRDRCRLIGSNAGSTSGFFADFDIDEATVGSVQTFGTGTGSAATIEDAGDGWYRCTIVGVIDATSTVFLAQLLLADASGNATYNGDGSSGMYFWGAQAEQGAFPSSYIKTEGLTASHAVESASFSPTISSTRSGVVEGKTAPGSGTQIIWQIDDGTADERLRIERNSSDEIHFIATAGGADVADLSLGTVADETSFKVAFSAALNDFRAVLNGGAVQSDTGGAFPSGMGTGRIGHNHTPANHWFGTISRIREFAGTVNNSNLIKLST